MEFANAVQPSKLDEAPRRLVWEDLASIPLGRRAARQHYLSRGGLARGVESGELVGPCYTHGCGNSATDII